MPTVNVKKFDVGKLTKITNGNVVEVMEFQLSYFKS